MLYLLEIIWLIDKNLNRGVNLDFHVNCNKIALRCKVQNKAIMDFQFKKNSTF